MTEASMTWLVTCDPIENVTLCLNSCAVLVVNYFTLTALHPKSNSCGHISVSFILFNSIPFIFKLNIPLMMFILNCTAVARERKRARGHHLQFDDLFDCCAIVDNSDVGNFCVKVISIDSAGTDLLVTVSCAIFSTPRWLCWSPVSILCLLSGL